MTALALQLLASAFASSPSAVSVSIDVTGATTAFPHNWERSFGSGHALLATRADWQQHLQICVDKIGLRGVRMHGVLDDDMSVTPDGSAPS